MANVQLLRALQEQSAGRHGSAGRDRHDDHRHRHRPAPGQVRQAARLGVTGARSPLAPEVPTIAQAGVPGYEMGYWFAACIGARRRTWPRRLNELLVKATQSGPAKQFYARTGTDPPAPRPKSWPASGGSGEMRDIIKKAGIQPVSTTRRHARRPVLPRPRGLGRIYAAPKSPSRWAFYSQRCLRRDRRYSTNARSTTVARPHAGDGEAARIQHALMSASICRAAADHGAVGLGLIWGMPMSKSLPFSSSSVIRPWLRKGSRVTVG